MDMERGQVYGQIYIDALAVSRHLIYLAEDSSRMSGQEAERLHYEKRCCK